MVSKSEPGMIPFEVAAMNGEEMPAGLSAPDQLLFQSLRYLYVQWRHGVIDKDAAIKEKRMMVGTWQNHRFWDELFAKVTEQIKLTELARAEYRKSPTVENGMKLVRILEGGYAL